MKPFAEFTSLDWHLWHQADKKARGVYWAETNRRDKQRTQGKSWDKYYRKSSQSLVQAPVQSQSSNNIVNNQNMKLLIKTALGFA